MSIVSKPNTFSANTTISSSQVNANFDTLYNDYNGGVSAANLATSAVTTAKIADDAVTTAKVLDANVTAPKLNNSGTWNSSWAWSSWTPTWTNLTVGNSTVVAKYTQIGKTVHCRVSVEFGSTGSATSSVVVGTLPVTANSEYTGTRVFPSGYARFSDNGTNYVGYVRLSSSTEFQLLAFTTSSSNATEAVIPFAAGSSDVFSMTFRYEAA